MSEDQVYSYIRRFLMVRQDRLYTQAQLANKVGTTQAAIARFESCKINPTLGFLHNMAEALEVDMRIELDPKSEYDQFFKDLLAKESEFR